MNGGTRFTVGLAVVAALGGATAAGAQSLGTFSWQLQPYCNVVTVNVQQTGGAYTLDGYDNQCGALQRAPLVGLATPNPDGTIGLGLQIVTVPGAQPVNVEARITLPSVSGTWTDSAGNSGTFAFGGSGNGSPRPAPTVLAVPAIAVVGNGTVGGTLTAANVEVSGTAMLGGSVLASGFGSFGSGLQTAGDLRVTRVSNTTSLAASLDFERYAGVSGALLPVTAGMLLGEINMAAFNGTTVSSALLLRASAAQNWSNSARGTTMTLGITRNNTTSLFNAIAIDGAGLVGIGTTSPDQQLTVNGNASKPGGGTWAVFSDARLKHVFGGYARGLEAVLALQPVRYEYTVDNPLGIAAGGEHVGFVAQAVREVIPEAVSDTASGYMQVNSDPILWAMLNAIKQLKAENDALRARVSALETTTRDQR